MEKIRRKAEYADQNGECWTKARLEAEGAKYKVLNKYQREENNVIYTLYTIHIISFQTKLF